MLQQRTFQAKNSGPHAFQTQGEHAPKWYVVDAKDQVVGRLATVVARVLMGKHKPTYTKHVDTGDFVVVLNADKIALTRNKWEKKKYYRHSQYTGGLKTFSARQMHEHDPEEILRLAITGMIPKNALGRRQALKLKLFTGVEHPHQAQQPLPLPASVVRETVLEGRK